MANQGKLDFLLNFRTNIGGVSDKIKKEVKGLVKDGETKFSKLKDTMGSTMGSTQKLGQAFDALKSSSPFDLLQRGADKFGAAFGPSAQFIVQQFTSIGAVMAMTAAKAWHAAGQVDKAMFLLRNTTNATADQQYKLSGAIADVTMELGLGQDQAGRMAVGLTKAGLATGEVAKGMKTLGKLNHATQIDTGRLTDVFAIMHKQMGTTAAGFASFGEHFFRTQRVTAIGADELLAGVSMITDGVVTYYDNLSRVSGVSKDQMIKDLTSVFAMIEPLGQEGSALMQSFMANSRDLSSAQFADLRKMAGDHGAAMEAAIRSGNLDVAFTEMLEGIKSIDAPMAEMSVLMERTFGIPGGGKLISILKESNIGMEGLADQLGRVKDSTSLKDAAEHLELSKMLFQTWNRISAALEPVGQMLLSILAPVLGLVNFIVVSLGKVLSTFAPILGLVGKLVGWVIALVAGVATFVVVAMTVVKVLGFIGAAIVFIKANILGIMAAMAGWLVIIFAIAGIVWAIDAAFKKVFGVGLIDIFTKALEVVMSVLKGIVDTVMWIVDGIGDIWDYFFGGDEKEVDITVNKKIKEKTDAMKKPVTAPRDRVDFKSLSRRRLDVPPSTDTKVGAEADQVGMFQFHPSSFEERDTKMLTPSPVTDPSKDIHKSIMSTDTSGEKTAKDVELVEILKEIRDESKKGNDRGDRQAGENYAVRHRN